MSANQPTRRTVLATSAAAAAASSIGATARGCACCARTSTARKSRHWSRLVAALKISPIRPGGASASHRSEASEDLLDAKRPGQRRPGSYPPREHLRSQGRESDEPLRHRSAARSAAGADRSRTRSAMFDITPTQNKDIGPLSPATDDQADNEGLFVRETHHRMKNTLALLGAWLRADFRSTALVDLPTAIDGFGRRIVAFGRLYDLLSNGSNRRYTSIGDYVGSLSRALAVAIPEPKGISCEATIGYGFLETKRCERLGLIIAELVTNAARHAFPSRQPGLIRIEAFYRDGFWHCTVKDSGVGTCGARRGVGERIVKDLAQSIGGHVITKSCSDGTAVTVVVPHHIQSNPRGKHGHD